MTNFAALAGSPISGAAVDAAFASKADAAFASARASSISRQVADKLRDFDAAGDFGIYPGMPASGTDTAIAAALSAMSAGGGRLNLRAGTYLSTQPWTVTSGIYLAGAGQDNTTLAIATAGASCISYPAGTFSAGVSDLTCTAAAGVTHTSGGTITVAAGSHDIRLSRLGILVPFAGIRLSSCQLIFADHIKIVNPTRAIGCGILIDQASGQAYGNDHYLRDIFIQGDPNNQPRCAVDLVASGGTWMDTVGGLFTGHGLLIEPGNGQYVEQCFTSRCAWDSGSGHGMAVLPAAGGTVRRMGGVGNWTATMAQHGILLGGAGAIDSFRERALRSLNNGQNGINIANAAAINTRFEGEVAGNSTNNANAYDGVLVAANTTDFELDVRSGNPGQVQPLQRYGVCIMAGASNRYAVRGNLSGNLAGGLNDGGTGSTKLIQLFGN